MPIAYVFPGQGSQRPGMGAPWRDTPGWVLVTEASEVLGRDLAWLLLDADAESLRAPREAQISTFLTSMLALEAVRSAHPQLTPVAVAGHSLGEYSALVAAGAVSLTDAVRLVGERGEAMQAASLAAPGTMAAVLGLDPSAVQAALAEVDGCWVANLNGPGNVVITGSTDGLAAGSEAALAAGARRVLPIPVGGAFHSPLMAAAADRLGTALATASWADAPIPVICNVDAAPHTAAGDWADLLARQLTSPVRWTETLGQLDALGVEVVAEIGPGTVLTGITKRAMPGVLAMSVGAPPDIAALAAGTTG